MDELAPGLNLPWYAKFLKLIGFMWWGPVESATGDKVEAPLEEGSCGWVGPQV